MLIGRIDRSVDRLVYDLHGLMEEEVKTIEESLVVNREGCRGGRKVIA